MKKKKGQISTEYLIVFGIAFLIILAGVFAFMKFSKSGALQQETCLIATGEQKCVGSALKAKVGVDGNSRIQLRVENLGDPMLVKTATITPKTGVTCKLGTGQQYTVTATEKTLNLEGANCKLEVGDKVDADFTIKYQVGNPGSGLIQSFTGHLTGTVQ